MKVNATGVIASQEFTAGTTAGKWTMQLDSEPEYELVDPTETQQFIVTAPGLHAVRFRRYQADNTTLLAMAMGEFNIGQPGVQLLVPVAVNISFPSTP